MLAMNDNKSILRAYHAACYRAGMSDDDKREILAAYNVKSSKDLSIEQLSQILSSLNQNSPNQWRRKVIAAVNGFLQATGQAKAKRDENLNYIKAIACRSTGSKNFNSIAPEKLRACYYEFVKKQKQLRP